MSAKALGEYVDSGNNLIVVADGPLSKLYRDVAAESGVTFDDDNTRAIDHFNYDTQLDDGKHNVLVVDQENQFTNRQVIINNRKQFSQRPVLFRGYVFLSWDEITIDVNYIQQIGHGIEI